MRSNFDRPDLRSCQRGPKPTALSGVRGRPVRGTSKILASAADFTVRQSRWLKWTALQRQTRVVADNDRENVQA